MSNINDFEFIERYGGYGVLSYRGSDENVVVPADFNGQEIVEILPRAFFKNNKMTNITLPNTIKKIYSSSFEACIKLEEITIPPSVDKIECWAFLDCTSLKRVFGTNKKIEIHKHNFINSVSGKYSLEEISYHIWSKLELHHAQNVSLVKSLSTRFETFTDAEKKECISFLKRKKKMRDKFFASGEADVISFYLSIGIKPTLEETNKHLEENIRRENTKVTAILLEYKEKNFSSEQKEQFEENKEMVEIGLELPTLKQFKEKWTCSIVSNKVIAGLRISRYKLNKVQDEIIPKELACGTKIIAMKYTDTCGYSKIRKLVIEAELENISEKTFFAASDLEEVILPDTVDCIGRSAFAYCRELHRIHLSSALELIEKEAFRECIALEHIEIPKNVKEIKDKAFMDCANLKTVVVSSSTVIGKKAFVNCPLVNVEIK